MHVGGGTSDLAQPRCLECVLGRRKPQHRAATTVLARQTDVMERIIGKGEAAVAFHAAALAGKQPKSGDLVLGQRMLVTGNPAIETSLGRNESPFVGSDCLSEI